MNPESNPGKAIKDAAASVKESVTGVKMPKSVSKVWSGAEDEKNELCPTLTFQQRIYCFIGCLIFGFFLSILSWFAVFERKWTRFGILMTCSNITAIGGSMFLAGPMKQVKKMFEETRFIATGVYIAAMVLTVVAAFVLKNGAVVIVCCIIQYLAMVWYGLSYIPYARTVVKSCIGGAV